MKNFKRNPILKIYFDYTLVLVYKNEYIRILYVWSYSELIYNHRWFSMVTYSTCMVFASLPSQIYTLHHHEMLKGIDACSLRGRGGELGN